MTEFWLCFAYVVCAAFWFWLGTRVGDRPARWLRKWLYRVFLRTQQPDESDYQWARDDVARRLALELSLAKGKAYADAEYAAHLQKVQQQENLK